MKNLVILIMLFYHSISFAQVTPQEGTDTLTQLELQEKIKLLEYSINNLKSAQLQESFFTEKQLKRNIKKSKAGIAVGSTLILSGIALLISGAATDPEEDYFFFIFGPSDRDIQLIAGLSIGLTGMGLTIKSSKNIKENKKKLQNLTSHQIKIDPKKVGYIMTF